MRKSRSALLSFIMSAACLLGAGSAPADEHAAVLLAEGQAGQADALLGKWKHPEEDLVLEVQKSGAGYEGKIVKSTLAKAPVGKLLMRGVTYDAAKGEWRGEIFAVKRDQFVPMTAKLNGAGSLVMKAGKGLMSKELVWPRG